MCVLWVAEIKYVYVSDMELGHWVTWWVGHLGHLSRPDHRVIILTRCETLVFPVFEKIPKMQNVYLKCWNDESHCQVSVVGLKSLEVSSCNELLLKILWPENFFGVHYRTGSPGQLGLRVAGFPGHWVAGSQNVTQFHVWYVYVYEPMEEVPQKELGESESGASSSTLEDDDYVFRIFGGGSYECC